MADETMSPKAVLIAFILCAVADFVWGYFNGHTLGSAIIAVILGLVGTAWYAYWFTRPNQQ